MWEVWLHHQAERQSVPRMALNVGARQGCPVNAPCPACRTQDLVSLRVKVHGPSVLHFPLHNTSQPSLVGNSAFGTHTHPHPHPHPHTHARMDTHAHTCSPNANMRRCRRPEVRKRVAHSCMTSCANCSVQHVQLWAEGRGTAVPGAMVDTLAQQPHHRGTRATGHQDACQTSTARRTTGAGPKPQGPAGKQAALHPDTK